MFKESDRKNLNAGFVFEFCWKVMALAPDSLDDLNRLVQITQYSYFTLTDYTALQKCVPVRCNANKNTVLMHHKFCLLDSPQRVAAILKKQNKTPDKGQVRSILMTGSVNWTMQGFGGNWENILITNNVQHISKYSEEFERLWQVFDVDAKVNNKK